MSELDDILDELRGQFYRSAAERFERIEQALAALESMPPAAPETFTTLRELMRQFHSLAGAGSTFSYPAITTLARQSEQACDLLLEQNRTPAPEDLGRWRESLADLRREVAQSEKK
ncbi:MAG TPA: Hpt domain-containing protein [Blastocatellia bacterium]|nr:Hpt domain-containing protein [Blastocatellia bacterium]